jgi:glucokinase
MRTFIGIDLGGTQVRCGLVDEKGNILKEVRALTEANKGNEHVIETIVGLVKSIDGFENAVSIGLGSPGLIDHKNGVVISAANLDFNRFPLKDEIQKYFTIPVYVGNDANVAALAEAVIGAGKNYDIVQYITISTGIGGGLIINGNIVGGLHGCAGEIGNLIVNDEVFNHRLFNDGAFELNASGTSLTRKAQVVFPAVEHAGDLFKLALENEVAQELVDGFIDHVAKAMANIAHVVDPDCFVIGGGVSKSFHYFDEKLLKKYKSYVFEFMHDGIIIEKALLDDPGIVGAAMLGFKG